MKIVNLENLTIEIEIPIDSLNIMLDSTKEKFVNSRTEE
jgi:hypothetical protein